MRRRTAQRMRFDHVVSSKRCASKSQPPLCDAAVAIERIVKLPASASIVSTGHANVRANGAIHSCTLSEQSKHCRRLFNRRTSLRLRVNQFIKKRPS